MRTNTQTTKSIPRLGVVDEQELAELLEENENYEAEDDDDEDDDQDEDDNYEDEDDDDDGVEDEMYDNNYYKYIDPAGSVPKVSVIFIKNSSKTPTNNF